MEVPLRTAYGQNGRCGMQPKAKHSLRAQAQLMRTETVETFELVKVKQKLLDMRAEKERRKNAREQLNLTPPTPPQVNTTWSVFTKTLANTENCYLPQASSTPEIESQLRELTSEILTAHANASKPMIHSEKPFVQGEHKHHFRERNRARKLWQFTNYPQHKTELNRIQNKIKRKVGLYRQQVWEEHLTSLDAEDGSLWETAKALRKKASPISALNGPNGIALSDTNKTDLIAKSLESQFQLNDIHNPHKDEIITNIVDAYINNHTNYIDPILSALPSEVINYIKKIKIKKSPGRDGITNKMIKNLPLLTVFKITNIIKYMFKLR
ncbi:uncharacterized protein TNCV_1202831 [Trichonephila clavipes]|nr:uncharacterized protein TNCV_1202831 [Trichonephila clavipes]